MGTVQVLGLGFRVEGLGLRSGSSQLLVLCWDAGVLRPKLRVLASLRRDEGFKVQACRQRFQAVEFEA